MAKTWREFTVSKDTSSECVSTHESIKLPSEIETNINVMKEEHPESADWGDGVNLIQIFLQVWTIIIACSHLSAATTSRRYPFDY